MKTKKAPSARKKNVVIQKLNDELLVYDLDRNKAVCLNSTASTIWELCDAKNSIEEIALKFNNRLDAQIDDQFVGLALSQLSKENLLDDPLLPSQDFDKVSRRDAIRKIGLSSAIALPIVYSVVAPSAALAQSGIAPGNANGPACFGAGLPICLANCAPPSNCQSGSQSLQNCTVQFGFDTCDCICD